MEKNGIDMQEILRLAKSPAGKQLIAMLRQKDPEKLQQAARQAGAGNYSQAMESLQDVLSTPEGKQLLKELGR